MFPSDNIPSSIFSSHGRNSPTVRWCHGVELWINSHHVTRRVKLELSFRPILLDVSQRILLFFQMMHLYLYPPYAFLEFIFTIQCIYLLVNLFTFHIALLYSLIAFYCIKSALFGERKWEIFGIKQNWQPTWCIIWRATLLEWYRTIYSSHTHAPKFPWYFAGEDRRILDGITENEFGTVVLSSGPLPWNLSHCRPDGEIVTAPRPFLWRSAVTITTRGQNPPTLRL